ncbi:MAG: FAD-dependent oxidoreductase [Chloroflexota bacterium]
MGKSLCQPITIGRMMLKNRMVMPPMVVRYATADGYVSERTLSYYEARAKGGAGLIIIEATYIHPRGPILPNELALYDDRYVPGMRELARVIQRHGAKVAVQLIHGGRMTNPKLTGMQPLAPSAVTASGVALPKEMTRDDINEVIRAFVRAALRAKAAGFNGVEIHGAHGYLIDQFISPATNHRRDSYGGSLQNRAHLLVEVIRAVKEAVGDNLTIWCRLNGREYGVVGGTTQEEAKEVARMAADAGAAAIHVSAGGPANPANLTTARFTPAVLADLAAGIREVVNVPVIAVGKMTPEAGEALLAAGRADLIAFGRSLLADPELPNRVCDGSTEDIRPCILCGRCRDDISHSGVVGIRCTVGVATGREATHGISRTPELKKVLIVGGGPAGIEAARVSALRGHQVSLWEKKTVLGGQMVAAAIAPHKDKIGVLTCSLMGQLQKLGVAVSTGREATAESIAGFAPDVVVLATGVIPLIPEIPGLDKTGAVLAADVLEGKAKTGERVVIIGGELVACEVAEFLTDAGKKVTMMRRGAEIATDVGPSTRPRLLARLTEKGVTMLTGVTYHEANEKGLVITTGEGERKVLEADTIVLAAGATPNQALYREIKGKIPEVYPVGDCVSPRNIAEALREGFEIGLKI